MGEVDGWLPSGEAETPEEREVIVAGLVGDFVEPAKVQALEKLDEGRRAYGIAERWLRPKLASRPESPPWSAGVGEPTAQHRQGDARRGGSEG